MQVGEQRGVCGLEGVSHGRQAGEVGLEGRPGGDGGGEALHEGARQLLRVLPGAGREERCRLALQAAAQAGEEGCGEAGGRLSLQPGEDGGGGGGGLRGGALMHTHTNTRVP